MSSRDIIFAAAGGSPSTPDPYFENVTLLLDGNGTNGGQNNTFLDSSTNNFTITRNGNTTQGSFSPYGTLWSNYFDGSGDNLSIASNSALNFDTGTFTVEAWFNQSTLAFAGIVSKWPNIGGDNWLVATNGDGAVRFYYNGGNILGGSYTVGTWNHVAVSRDSSNVIRLFLNGTQVASVTSSFNSTGTAPVEIGSYASNSNNFTGYISNVRVVKGTAVYTSAFTPSLTPLTAITNTQLLTCQSNRFIDNSSNAFAITVNGNTSVQRFSPFEPSAPYSTSVIGGSGYFDASGDYLNTTGTTIGSSDYTLEYWIYPTSGATLQGVFSTDGGTTTGTLRTGIYDGKLYVDIYNGTGSINLGSNIVLNTWTHVAITKSGSSYTSYLNGVVNTTWSDSTSIFGTAWLVGMLQNTSNFFRGYVSNLRLVVGSVVYTGAFTPPTAPATAITNTQFLLSMTNASIFDYAMQNNLETVANAQISTSVTKFGTGSLAFDGVGDCLFAPSANQSFSLGATFTIEFWIYNTKTSGFGGVIGHTGTNWYTGIPITYVEGGASTFGINSYAGSLTKSGLSNSTWYHIAIVSENNSAKLYVNGTLESGPLSQAVTGTPAYLTIGKHDGTNSIADFSGYLDDLRITKGVARYTSNFTPPTSALPIY